MNTHEPAEAPPPTTPRLPNSTRSSAAAESVTNASVPTNSAKPTPTKIKLSWWWFLPLVAIGVLTLLGFYFQFHTMPLQKYLHDLLQKSEQLEITLPPAGPNETPTTVLLRDPVLWDGLQTTLIFKNVYWQSSDPPPDTIQIRLDTPHQIYSHWQLDGTNRLYLQKSGHWYYRFIIPEFRQSLQELLEQVDVVP